MHRRFGAAGAAKGLTAGPLSIATSSDGAAVGSGFRVDMNNMIDDRVNRRTPDTLRPPGTAARIDRLDCVCGLTWGAAEAL